ncbi:MAG: dehydratase, partial [Candidatus Rokubacteria bacterium]|nr:dehydratase [Candidatus Rokubacteria bacterium]
MAGEDRRYFDEIEVGEEYVSPGRTVTEADIVIFAGLSG